MSNIKQKKKRSKLKKMRKKFDVEHVAYTKHLQKVREQRRKIREKTNEYYKKRLGNVKHESDDE